MYEQITTCKKCQSARSTNLKLPCESCGAHFTIFGYLYEHEFKTFMWATTIILVFACLACIAGTIFLTAQSYLLTN